VTLFWLGPDQYSKILSLLKNIRCRFAVKNLTERALSCVIKKIDGGNSPKRSKNGPKTVRKNPVKGLRRSFEDNLDTLGGSCGDCKVPRSYVIALRVILLSQGSSLLCSLELVWPL
jgi:hypothetical protein